MAANLFLWRRDMAKVAERARVAEGRAAEGRAAEDRVAAAGTLIRVKEALP